MIRIKRKVKWYEILIICLAIPFIFVGLVIFLSLVMLGVVAALIGIVILIIFLFPVVYLANLFGRKR